MAQQATRERFAAALETLVATLRTDRTILAAILCGSLSHDVVWEKSDIDLALVTADDKHDKTRALSIDADGVNVHAWVLTRTDFRKLVEGTTQHSFMHSILCKGRLLYTNDETIRDLVARLHEIGAHDTAMQMLRAAMHALASLDKARKWFVTRGDLNYTALWLLYAATPLAQIEVLSHRQLVDREVILQALGLNPSFFRLIYTDLLNEPKSRESVEGALVAAEAYVAERATTIFAPILEHLEDAGDIRASREIDDHFLRHFNIDHVTTACEYLADRELVGKASAPARLTRRSQIEVPEQAFYHLSRRG